MCSALPQYPSGGLVVPEALEPVVVASEERAYDRLAAPARVDDAAAQRERLRTVG